MGKRDVTSSDTDTRRPPPATPSRVIFNALERFAAESLGTRFGFFIVVAVLLVVVAGAREEIVDAGRSGDGGLETPTVLLGMVATFSGGGFPPLKARPSTPMLRAARAARI